MKKKLIQSETERQLIERLKELNLIIKMSDLGLKGLSAADFVSRFVKLIPSAMQFPKSAKVRVTIDGKQFTSSVIEKTSCRLSEKIKIFDEKRGLVEIFYTKKINDPNEKAFLEEEKKLIKLVSRKIGYFYESEIQNEEKEKLFKQLQHQNRLASIGEISSGMVHEANNMLCNILGFAQLVAKDETLNKKTRSDIEKIIVICLNSREKMKKLMYFTSIVPAEFVNADLNTLIKNSLKLISWLYERKNISVHYKLEKNLPPINADVIQINQIIVNLVINAVQAMPNGGILTISTGKHDSYNFFSVEDTGIGIPDDVIQKIFDPFFTTKEVAEGTGLGLSVVHGIVHSHKGNISVSSKINGGTKFIINFPITT